MLTLALALSASDALALTVSASGPILRGQPVTLTATGAAPGQGVSFAYGTAPGPGPCPPALGGLCLDVVNPVLLGQRAANARGVATLALTVPANAPLTDLVLQAVQGGPVPAESAVLPAPVLQDVSGGLWVTDRVSLEEARHTRSCGSLIFHAGYPVQVDLPHLESVDGLMFEGSTPLVLTAPALRSANALTVQTTAGGRLDASFPVLDALGHIGAFPDGQGVAHQDDWILRLPALTRLGVQGYGTLVMAGAGDAALDAPLLVDGAGVMVTIGPVAGRVDLNLPNLQRVWDLDILGLGPGTTTIDGWLPGLTSIGDLANPGYLTFVDLQYVTRIGRIGSAGGVSATALEVARNPSLTSVGLTNVRATYVSVVLNPLLPSCDALPLASAASVPQLPLSCANNARDTCSDELSDPCACSTNPGDACWGP